LAALFKKGTTEERVEKGVGELEGKREAMKKNVISFGSNKQGPGARGESQKMEVGGVERGTERCERHSKF